MLIRWGLASLPEVLAKLSVERPLLVSTERWHSLDVPVEKRFYGARSHAELGGVRSAMEQAQGADSLVALGGGSAIDTAKAVSAETALPVISIPTTYSGAEWTHFFGNRDEATGLKSAGGGAQVKAIVYDTGLTLDLPPLDTGGTALNALAHCAEALYAKDRNAETDSEALAGAAQIAGWLPTVLEDGHHREGRQNLLEGAMHAGAALRAGMGLGHAMVQALGGRLGLPHGPMNAVCLPLALRFNRETVPNALDRLASAMRSSDPVARIEQLAILACPPRLRDYGVPRESLKDVAAAAAVRPAAKANPRPASPRQILELLDEVW